MKVQKRSLRVLLALVAAPVLGGVVHAETIVVTTTDPAVDAELSPGVPAVCDSAATTTVTLEQLCPDGAGGHLSPCDAPGISIVEALCAAETNPGSDTVTLAAGATYTLTTSHNDQFGHNGLPAINSEIVIEGNGATIERAGGGQEFRFFFVFGTWHAGVNGSVEVGHLTLRALTLRGGIARGHDGGEAKTGGAGGGAGGFGGAIFNGGTTALRDVTIEGSTAIGGMGGWNGPFGGTGGGGGGGLSSAGGISQFTSTFGGAAGLGGGGAGGDADQPGQDGGFGGGGGGGGGEVSDAVGGFGGFGGGRGGDGQAVMGDESVPGWSLGGGVFNHLGQLTVTNSTITGNSVQEPAPGGFADGAGIYNVNGAVALYSVTLAGNSTADIWEFGGTDFSSKGGEVTAGVVQPASLHAEHTIFVSSGGGSDALRSRDTANTGVGNLVVSLAGGSNGIPAGLIMTNADPGLASLADNGGPSPTMAAGAGLPTGPQPCTDPLGGTLAVDQRGAIRPATVCAVGAYQPPAPCTDNLAAPWVSVFRGSAATVAASWPDLARA